MCFRQIVPVINQLIWVDKSSRKNGILVSVTEAELSETLLFQAKPWSTGLSSPSELALTLGSHEGTQMVKNLSAMQETQVRSLGQEDPLEKGNPLQYSCLENPMGRGDWWVTTHGVAESQTQLSDKLFPFPWDKKEGTSSFCHPCWSTQPRVQNPNESVQNPCSRVHV